MTKWKSLLWNFYLADGEEGDSTGKKKKKKKKKKEIGKQFPYSIHEKCQDWHVPKVPRKSHWE